jgi:phosphatidylglycerol:prolipoprotein diacylglycerol transferase
VAGFSVTLRLAERADLPRAFVGNCYVVAAFTGLVGARALYVVGSGNELVWIEVFGVRQGGFVAYGGFLGGALGAAWYCRRHRVPLRRVADAAAPALALGICWTRLGCYWFGCDFGTRLGSAAPAWLRRLGSFPRWLDGPLSHRGSPAWHQQVDQGLLSPFAQTSMPVHPTQLYEAVAGLFLLVLVLALGRARRFHGHVFLGSVLGYAGLRFAIEAIRGDAERGHLGPVLPTAWFVPLFAVAMAAAWFTGPARGAVRWTGAVGLVVAGIACASVAPTASPLSTSQWLALLTAAAALFAQRRWSEAGAARV